LNESYVNGFGEVGMKTWGQRAGGGGAVRAALAGRIGDIWSVGAARPSEHCKPCQRLALERELCKWIRRGRHENVGSAGGGGGGSAGGIGGPYRRHLVGRSVAPDGALELGLGGGCSLSNTVLQECLTRL
jgi:hypothetical protein